MFPFLSPLYSEDSGTMRSSSSPSTFSDIVCRPQKGLGPQVLGGSSHKSMQTGGSPVALVMKSPVMGAVSSAGIPGGGNEGPCTAKTTATWMMFETGNGWEME